MKWKRNIVDTRTINSFILARIRSQIYGLSARHYGRSLCIGQSGLWKEQYRCSMMTRALSFPCDGISGKIDIKIQWTRWKYLSYSKTYFAFIWFFTYSNKLFCVCNWHALERIVIWKLLALSAQNFWKQHREIRSWRIRFTRNEQRVYQIGHLKNEIESLLKFIILIFN